MRDLNRERPIGGAALKYMREMKMMSSMQLAAKAGLNQSCVGRFEAGLSDVGNMRISTASALASALGIPVQDFIRQLINGPDIE